MKHKKNENQSGLIIRLFRLPKKLDLKGKEVIVKIIKHCEKREYSKTQKFTYPLVSHSLNEKY